MRKILLAGLTVAPLSAGWCPSAEAGPLESGARAVKSGVVKVLKRLAHPLRKS